ncbi:MAG: hypothetical protein GY798_13065 [Hyphomicrobiales bacterium]|nr:hypothetical protein [Hyphomicrobiales bacterium]
MSDFYAVLKQSIIDRELRSPDDRDAAYAQARAAIVRRLWSYDPPLSEDEIDDRIGQFDLAVERIESEVIEVFAAGPEPVDQVVPANYVEAPPPVYDDPERDDGDERHGNEPTLEPDDIATSPGDIVTAGSGAPPTAKRRESVAELFVTLDARSLAVEQALNGQADEPAVAPELATPAGPEPPLAGPEPPLAPDHPELDDFVPPPGLLPEHAPNAEEPPPDEGNALVATDEPVNWYRPNSPATAPPSRKRKIPPQRPATAGRPRRARASRPDTDTRQVRSLIVAVTALAAALIAALVYVLSPLYLGNNEPVLAGPPGLPGSAGTASLPADSLQRFTLFDGSDPTIFKAAPGNPVRFSGEAARISTSAGSAGATAAIGPGLATRLAGHNVRVTVMARTVRENGALNLRIAYQSGLAISHWRTANLTAELAPVELEWRVPALRTDPGGGAILIEPGIPGDGTAAEIAAITIDVLD